MQSLPSDVTSFSLYLNRMSADSHAIMHNHVHYTLFRARLPIIYCIYRIFKEHLYNANFYSNYLAIRFLSHTTRLVSRVTTHNWIMRCAVVRNDTSTNLSCSIHRLKTLPANRKPIRRAACEMNRYHLLTENKIRVPSSHLPPL